MSFNSIAVTGGAGFIGSHLTERLIKMGKKVRVIDNLATGRLSNLDPVKSSPNLDVVQSDIASDPSLGDHLKGIDCVLHLAALADIVPSIQKPTDYYQTNVTGTVRVLEAVRANGIKKVVYAASSSCYGIPDATPTPEAADIRPEYPYALTKNLGEQCALHWSKVYKIPLVSLRFFNVYGPRSRTTGAYGAVFGVFLAQKLSGKDLTIVGDGSQTRDFTYVTDVADAVITAAQSDAAGEIFNVGSGATISVNRIAELIGGNKTYIPKRPGEPDITFADISKIQSVLGWSPKVKIEDGVKEMLSHIDDWRDAPVWTPSSIKEATKDWFEYLGPRKA